MKAEHRKQLQTNVLADRMGRFVQSLKQRPQRRTVIYVIVGLAVVVGAFIFFTSMRARRVAESEAWANFDNGYYPFIYDLAGVRIVERDNKRYLEVANDWKYGKTSVGKAARFEYAWATLWDEGVRQLASQPRAALDRLTFAKSIYSRLAENCKDDPVWEPEARYGLATIDETLAVLDRAYLDKAREKYAQLAEKFPSSAAGQRAEKKAALLKANSASLQAVQRFYADLARELAIDADKLKRELKLDSTLE